MLIRILLWTELPVEVAMENNHAKIVEILLDEISKDGDTLLHIAARLGNDKLVKYALSTKIDRNAQNEAGFTALHIAALEGYVDTVKLLLEAGLDPNMTTPCRFRTALSLTINHVCNGHETPKLAASQEIISR